MEWLADRAGDRAVFRYYRLLPEATSREEAFSRAFQIAFDDLYEQVELYRATSGDPMTTSNPVAPEHVRRALIAALALLAALLLAAAAWSPSRVAASSESDEADTIPTVLYPALEPGRLAGARGALVTDLFDAIPTLLQVSAWDADHGAYRHGSCDTAQTNCRR